MHPVWMHGSGVELDRLVVYPVWGTWSVALGCGSEFAGVWGRPDQMLGTALVSVGA